MALLRCYDGTIWKIGVPDCFDTPRSWDLRCYDATMSYIFLWTGCTYTGHAYTRGRKGLQAHIWILYALDLRILRARFMVGVWLVYLWTAHGYFALACVGMHEGLAQVRAGDITYENHNGNIPHALLCTRGASLILTAGHSTDRYYPSKTERRYLYPCCI